MSGWAARLTRAATRLRPRSTSTTTRVGPGGSDPRSPAGAAASEEDRTIAALGLVGGIEAVEQSLPGAPAPATFLVRGRVARRAGAVADHSHLVPRNQRAGWGKKSDLQTAQVAVAADTVVLAKFDLRGHLKLRAHYRAAGLTLSVQPRDDRGQSGVRQAVRAHAVVDAVAPGLAPPLVAHGRASPATDYLVEHWVDGEPLLTDRALADAMPLLLGELGRLYRGHGIRWARPSTVWTGPMSPAWEAVRGTGLVDGDVWEHVSRLIRDDLPVRTTWVHGDPVASNILRTADGLTLVDWEHSRRTALMVDIAKLHLFTAEPDQVLDAVDDILPTGGRRDRAHGPGRAGTFAELVLMHARHLMQYPARQQVLAGHPRARVYERQVRRQVERLVSALGRSGSSAA